MSDNTNITITELAENASKAAAAADLVTSTTIAGAAAKFLVQKAVSEDFTSNIKNIVDDVLTIKRGETEALFNDRGIISVSPDGTVSISSGHGGHFKVLDSKVTLSNILTEIKTNTFSVDTDDVIINNHKLNNKLYELADFKNVLTGYDDIPKVAGGLTMLGTVLVKTWEPNLKRYVLMRRLINIPMFSPSLGGPNVSPGLKMSPAMDKINAMRKEINTTGISSEADLYASLKNARDIATFKKAEEIAKKNAEIAAANKAKGSVSMSALTGQDASVQGGNTGNTVTSNYNVSPQAVANNAQNKAEVEKKKDSLNQTNLSGWNDVDGCPNDPNAYWYRVHCKKHFFDIYKGKQIIKAYCCNYSYKGTNANKIEGDDTTPLGVFTIATIEEASQFSSPNAKYPDKKGAFGPWYMDLDLGGSLGTRCHIAVHGDFDSEDKDEKILLTDSPRGQHPKPGEGSTHGCIRLSNASVTELATKYAKIGQYIWIEE